MLLNIVINKTFTAEFFESSAKQTQWRAFFAEEWAGGGRAFRRSSQSGQRIHPARSGRRRQENGNCFCLARRRSVEGNGAKLEGSEIWCSPNCILEAQ